MQNVSTCQFVRFQVHYYAVSAEEKVDVEKVRVEVEETVAAVAFAAVATTATAAAAEDVLGAKNFGLNLRLAELNLHEII